MTLLRAALLLAAGTAGAADRPVRTLDLATPFGARAPWRLTVTQAPDQTDPIMGEGVIPGALTLCLSRDGGARCDPQPGTSLRGAAADDFDAPHELGRLAVVRPRPGRPLLLLQLASLHSADGDQRVGTELYAYDRATDAFHLAFRRQTGHNNNQEVRYIDTGPLAGAIVVAEPTADAPFGFWITAWRIGAAGSYRQVVRFRSATRYADGNPLAVIDSEMPALQQRLGLWSVGQRLPIPPHCAAPRLVHGALWCAPPSR